MIPDPEWRGFLVFGLIALVVAIAAIAAWQITGTMGIEDRFSQAVGLPVGEEESGGLPVEGNPVLYLVVLGVILTGCYIIYRKNSE